MIKFQKLRYKNFLSSGNYWTEINLSESNATLVVGYNGAGKSTMLDALTFSLFNKPFRKINKNQLVNTCNEKDCKVEIEFTSSGKSWKIIRGIKPSIFEIYRNNVLLDQAASANDQQKWIEQSLLKLNYKSFTQIIVLGSSNFVPFMQLSSQHRREVVEDLLDIKVFSSMNDVAKVKIKELRDEVREFSYKKENLQDKIDSQSKFILELQKRTEQDIEKKSNRVLEFENEIVKLNENIESLQKKIDVMNNDLSLLTYSEDDLINLENSNAAINQKISSLIDDHKFFKKNKICPTCTQNIEEEFRLNKIETIESNAKEIQEDQKHLLNSIKSEKKKQNEFIQITKEVSKLINDINFNNVEISGFRKQIKIIESEIQTLTSQNQDTNIEHEKLKLLNQSLEDLLQDISTKKEELQNYEFINLLLKDDGAKSKIIKKYLPIININLNKYLEILDFPVHFVLDEEFNERALNPSYQDFSYSSFSEGEKMRIDLALLFTWREVAKIKNSINTNLLILDEIFDSSLDEAGTDYFTKIIKFVIKNSNTFVISHKVDDLLEKFDKTIRFEKKKGFSMMVDSN
jgi:DNA repair exonuclease SbcCD ATPase subunit